MATYKVLQDIEADDKLLGPLSLKQFIFAAMFVGIGFLQFIIATSPAPTFVKIPIMIVLIIPMLLFGFLAAPIGRDQSTEIWLLARINFLFRPRSRIWNQDGINELVTITAPKKQVHVYTNGLSQTEVKSRLQALANTVDSRGWAIKNVNTNLFAQPGYLGSGTNSDRLIDPSSLPQEVPMSDVTAADDILDTSSNSTAQHLDMLIQESSATHRQQAISSMRAEATEKQTPTDYWFMNQAAPAPNMPLPKDYSTFGSQPVVAPGTTDIHPAAEETAEEHALAERLAKEKKGTYEQYNEHMKTIQPLHDRNGNAIVPDVPEPPKAQLNPVDPIETLYGNTYTDVLATAQVPAVEPESDDYSNTKPFPSMSDTPFVAPMPEPVQEEEQKPINPAILGLAHRDDLNVSTIARQAQRISEDDGEVVISLH